MGLVRVLPGQTFFLAIRNEGGSHAQTKAAIVKRSTATKGNAVLEDGAARRGVPHEDPIASAYPPYTMKSISGSRPR